MRIIGEVKIFNAILVSRILTQNLQHVLHQSVARMSHTGPIN